MARSAQVTTVRSAPQSSGVRAVTGLTMVAPAMAGLAEAGLAEAGLAEAGLAVAGPEGCLTGRRPS
jgi:hypothetical protein